MNFRLRFLIPPVLLFFSNVSIAQSLKSESPDDAAAAIDDIVQNKKADAATITQLMDALKDPGTAIHVKERAAWALGRLEAKPAVPALVEAAKNKGLLVRSAALDALAHMRSWSGIPVYTQIAQNDPVLSLRQHATLALGLTKSDSVIPTLVKLSADPTPEVRGADALAMGALQSKKNDFSQALQQMAADDSPYVRERVEKAIDIAHRKNAAIRDHLISSEPDIRLFAALYFHSYGLAKEVSMLKAAADADADEEVRYELDNAVKAIQKRGSSGTKKKGTSKTSHRKAKKKPAL